MQNREEEVSKKCSCSLRALEKKSAQFTIQPLLKNHVNAFFCFLVEVFLSYVLKY